MRAFLSARRGLIKAAVMAALAATLSVGSWAQSYPERPIRLIVPFPPGGPTDLTARLIAEKMTRTIGQPVIVDNRGGAAGMIGTTALAQSANDGYTFGMIGSGLITLTPHVRKDLPWDPIKDFVPIANTVQVPLVLAVNPSLNVKTIEELVALIKAHPGKYSYGSDGVATSTHLTFEYFKQLYGGLDVVHVPYKGTAQIINDMLANNIQMSISGIAGALAHHREGRLRILAATSAARAPALPDVPTFVEAGNKDFDVVAWFGLFAPGGTPAPIVRRLEEHATMALREPDVIEKLRAAGLIVAPSSARELADTVDHYTRLYLSIMKKANVELKD